MMVFPEIQDDTGELDDRICELGIMTRARRFCLFVSIGPILLHISESLNTIKLWLPVVSYSATLLYRWGKVLRTHSARNECL